MHRLLLFSVFLIPKSRKKAENMITEASMIKTFFTRISLLFVFCISIRAFALDFTGAGSFAKAFSSFSNTDENAVSFYSLTVPSGGRAEALGGAYTAVSDDNFCIDYNPAATSLLAQNEIALFHNIWIAGAAMETVAAAARRGNFGFGGELRFFYVPFYEYDAFGERSADSLYSETSAIFNISYNFLAGYYFKGIALGANAKVLWRSMPDASGSILSFASLSRSALALAVDAGIMLRFNAGKRFASREPNLRLALSVRNAGAAITDFGETIKTDDPLPTSVSIGLSYRPLKRLLAAAEFKQPVNLSNIGNYMSGTAGCAVDLSVTDFFTIFAGCTFCIDASAPYVYFQSAGGGISVTLFKRVRLEAAYTFDRFSSFTPFPSNHISAGAKILLGDGGRAKRRSEAERLYAEGLALFSGGDFVGAVETWNKVLALDPRFTPAAEGIESAQKQIDLQQRIRGSQSLEN